MANLSDLIAQSTSDNPQKLVNLALATQMMGSGSELGGTNYVFVRGDGTPEENAIELQAAYDTAVNMPRFLGSSLLSPSNASMYYKGQTFYYSDGGTPAYYMFTESTAVPTPVPGVAKAVISELEAKSTRTTVVVAPGQYKFGISGFTVDTPYINIVSLTGNSDVLLDGINVTANNVYLKGLNCGTNVFGIGDNLNGLICERCTGGAYSFVGTEGEIASGTFKGCVGGNGSFGGYGTFSGTATNCTGGDYSFGGGYGTFSGTATNCTGGYNSFGGYGTFSGTATNCTGGYKSFGGTISSAARLYYCRLTSGTFPTPAVGGKLVLCIDGDDTVVTTP